MDITAAVKIERTLALIKPDAVESGYAPTILGVMSSQFDIKAVHAAQWTRSAVEGFYIDLADRDFFPDLVDFMSSGMIFSVVLSGRDAVSRWRALIGPTDPKKAPMHTLRCTFGDHKGPVMRNAVHGSDTEANATKEIHYVDSCIRSGLILRFSV
jgi:nucleoside-diphosphate kinase